MNRQVAVVVTCSAADGALLARHPRFTVVWAAPAGNDRPDVAPAAGVAEAGTVSPSPEPLLVSYDDAATLLGLSERKIRQLVTSGELPVVAIGRSRRIRASDIAAYVERLGHQGPA